jgi:hypothetical protein
VAGALALAGEGKTSLPLEFAHRYRRDFEAVYWLPCQSSSLASIAAELERQLGLKLEADLPPSCASGKSSGAASAASCSSTTPSKTPPAN